MGIKYYSLPLCLNAILDGESPRVKTCNEIESIDQYIELIITTCPGEHKFNKNFGCRIWDMDFERVSSRKKWEEDFSSHIKTAIELFEQRIKDVIVSIHVMEVTKEDHAMNTTAIKKAVSIHVEGQLISSGHSCKFKYKFFLSPLSTE